MKRAKEGTGPAKGGSDPAGGPLAERSPADTPARPFRVPLDATETVSGLWQAPPDAWCCLVLAHGAGAGMTHPSMAGLADGLAARGVATLRYQFPFTERGGRRPDAPTTAHRAVRAAVAVARDLAGNLPLFAGGRSFGGRMTSQAQAVEPLGGVKGLVFFAFPLHPPAKPSVTRAAHLKAVALPMLFVQGTRDALATMDLLRPTVDALGIRASLVALDAADHSFHVPVASGRHDAEVRDALLDATVAWLRDRSS